MHRPPLLIIAAIAVMLPNLSAAEDLTYGAQNPAAPALKYDRKFSGLDRDGDYLLNRSEAAAQADLASQYESADANRDGSIDQAEFSVFEADARTPAGSSYNSTDVPIR